MKKILALFAVAGLTALTGCGGGGDDPATVPTPTGSGFLTGKWVGRLESYHYYRYYDCHWIINHEGSQIDVIICNDDFTANVSSDVRSGTLYASPHERLVVDGTNSGPVFLRISQDHNTLYNDFQGNGGELTRVVE